MSCYHPLRAYPIGISSNGKTKYKIISYESINNMDIKNYMDFKLSHVDSYITVPCGKCIGCRLDQSRRWADRLLLESLYHDESYFVTLTYNDEHVPMVPYSNDYGEYVGTHLTLKKRDFQLFMKRLRKAVEPCKIRFFGCGEYGTETLRPHYHAIIFGLHLTDLTPFSRNEQGQTLYRSEFVERCWSNSAGPIGHVLVGEFSWQTASYVARYVTKKYTGDMAKAAYTDLGIDPPFSVMSRRPGIGYQYYEEHPDLFDYEYIYVPTDTGGRKILPPRYYERMLERDNPDLYDAIKRQRRESAEDSVNAKMSLTDLSFLDMLKVQEFNKIEQTKILRRDGI